MLSAIGLAAQNNADHWYFGQNAGIVFNDGTVTAATGAMFTAEGCASISDGCGLLFYTDGDTVWNKDHVMMVNGYGLGGQCTAYGRQSATQSALILRQPGSDSLFYVFTTDCHEDELVSGLRYSIVNMAQANGLGAVVVKNQYLHGPIDEKVTAVKHANGCDIWIITHEYESNALYAYLLTSTGLEIAPVISHTGQIHDGDPQWNNCVRGYLKASPGGDHLISVTPDGVYWYCDSILPEVFSVDQATGSITSEFTIPGDTAITTFYDAWAIPFYGATFSPDGTKLYLSSGFYGPHLFQYNLSAGSVADILASKTLLNDTLIHGFPRPCALQAGPDGRIYVAQQWRAYLGVINQPNEPGIACDFVDSAVTLLPSTMNDWGGLPNFFEYYTHPSPLSAGFTHGLPAAGVPTQFTDGSTGASTYSWDFGDGGSSTLQNPTHTYWAGGYFTVTLTAKDELCNVARTCLTLFVTSPTGLPDPAGMLALNLYPNPFQNTTRLDLTKIPNATVEIHAANGARVYQSQHATHGQDHLYLGRDLPSGLFVLTVRTADAVHQCKLIKLR